MATETRARIKVEDLKDQVHLVIVERAGKQYTVTKFEPDPTDEDTAHIVKANNFASQCISSDHTILSIQVVARYREVSRIGTH